MHETPLTIRRTYLNRAFDSTPRVEPVSGKERMRGLVPYPRARRWHRENRRSACERSSGPFIACERCMHALTPGPAAPGQGRVAGRAPAIPHEDHVPRSTDRFHRRDLRHHAIANCRAARRLHTTKMSAGTAGDSWACARSLQLLAQRILQRFLRSNRLRSSRRRRNLRRRHQRHGHRPVHPRGTALEGEL